MRHGSPALHSSLCVPSWSDSATSPLRLWFPEGGLGPILMTHIYSLLLPQAKRPVHLALAYRWDGTMTVEPASWGSSLRTEYALTGLGRVPDIEQPTAIDVLIVWHLIS